MKIISCLQKIFISFTRFVWSLLSLMMNLGNSANGAITLSSLPSSDTLAYSSNGEEVAENDDLLCQILICLPAKSLLRFMCVSRKWSKIIRSHKFRINHTRGFRHPIITDLITHPNGDWDLLSVENDQNILQRKKTMNMSYMAAVDPHMAARVISFSNGLAICYVESNYLGYPGFYLTNPIAKSFISIPHPKERVNDCVYTLVLAFDPVKAPHFKVLCASNFIDHDGWIMMIYYSEYDQWRIWQGQLINARYMDDVFDSGVLWNDAMHWLCWNGDSVYFSLEDETMKVLPLPPSTSNSFERLLWQSGGHLLLTDVKAIFSGNQPMDIYEMKDDYGGWVFKQRVDLHHLGMQFPAMVGEFQLDIGAVSLPPSTHYSFNVLGMIWADDGESLDMILFIPDHIVSYNTKSNTAKVLIKVEEYFEMHEIAEWLRVLLYTATLFWFGDE